MGVSVIRVRRWLFHNLYTSSRLSAIVVGEMVTLNVKSASKFLIGYRYRGKYGAKCSCVCYQSNSMNSLFVPESASVYQGSGVINEQLSR